MTRKGFSVSVYRDACGSDCTNRGVTSRYARVVLIGEGIPELTEPNPDMPALYLCSKPHVNHCGATVEGAPYFYAQPEPKGCSTWYMMGGNFVYSCDSRFREICGYPIPVHDHTES